MERYYSYKNYLINKYTTKTYKLPIQIPVTCPNRDGTIGVDGCYFCSQQGTGFEAHDSMVPLKEQLAQAKIKVEKRYKAKKFIAYFQNYTNTYLPIDNLLVYLSQAASQGVVGIDIATRPDCLSKEYVEAIRDFADRTKLDITFEVGLQIANDQILKKVNRGHSVDDYINAVKLLKSKGFAICTHLILNLPDSTMEDVHATAKLMNDLKVDIVKLHSLYISKDSVYGRWFKEGKIRITSQEEYVKRVVEFISVLDSKIAISRLVSRIPKKDSDFSNWDQSWWKVYNDIMEVLEEKDIQQGMGAIMDE